MTYNETLMVLAVLKAAYPHAFKDMRRADGEAMAKLWQLQFDAEPFTDVQAAVNALISTRTVGYSPTIGEVKEKLHQMRSRSELTDSDAWAMVAKACTNGIYGYREEYAKLPPEVQAAVGAPEQLREWAVMDTETLQSVVASNFMRSYRTTRQRAKETAMLPQNVRDLLTGVSDSMKMLKE